MRRYAHLGTGNYNPNTARFYTDLSFLTANHEITLAVQHVFNYLTAHAESDNYLPLMIAPVSLADDMLAMVQRETKHAKAGRPARIIAKMNSLLDQTLIEGLYAASKAGVQVELIVRGICALRPGVKGLSENIRVISIVGRFLEHSRIFCFANGGEQEIYCGSADWMPRNLYERCEAVFPVRDEQLCARIRNEILEAYLEDTLQGPRAASRTVTTRASGRQTGQPLSVRKASSCSWLKAKPRSTSYPAMRDTKAMAQAMARRRLGSQCWPTLTRRVTLQAIAGHPHHK